ncbi:MAG TPA: universal stress protein [Candidatus Sulfotelmatobacter sp.]|nr:universal stress protein [Candidatus Sulfotelmatobacter sp.]
MPLEIAAVVVDPRTLPFCLAGAVAAAAVDPDSRIEAYHPRLRPEARIMPTEEVLTAARRAELEAAAGAQSAAMQAAFRAWAATAGPLAARVRWQEEAVEATESAVAARGGRADLVALVRPDDPEAHAALHAAIFETGRPLLLLPRDKAAAHFGRHLAIAWKADAPAEHAVAAARPWLRRAQRISVLMMGGSDDAPPLPAELAPLLDGSTAKPTVLAVDAGALSAGERLLQAATTLGADGLVMGAYRHPRIMELILGGVTREALRHAELPLFMMH